MCLCKSEYINRLDYLWGLMTCLEDTRLERDRHACVSMCSPGEGTVQFAIYPCDICSLQAGPPFPASGDAGLQMRLICTRYWVRLQLQCPAQCGDICITFKTCKFSKFSGTDTRWNLSLSLCMCVLLSLLGPPHLHGILTIPALVLKGSHCKKKTKFDEQTLRLTDLPQSLPWWCLLKTSLQKVSMAACLHKILKVWNSTRLAP